MNRVCKQFVFQLTAACFIMLVFVSIVPEVVSFSALPSLNIFIPVFLLTVCLWTGFWMVKADSLMVWAPLPWFLGACAVFYGFGPLIYHYGNPDSLTYIDAFHPVEEHGLFRTNLLNTVGIIATLIGYQIGIELLPPIHRKNMGSIDPIMLKHLLIVFLSVGIPIKYFLVLPSQLGLINWNPPGSINYFTIFPSLSIIVLLALVWNGKKFYMVPLFILIAAELIAGLMTFRKTDVIVVSLAILLGIYYCKPRIIVLIAGGIAVLLMYAALIPFMLYGRIYYRDEGRPGITSLADVAAEYSRADIVELPLDQNVQIWWVRLNYSNAQAYVMESYDSGNAGETYSLIPYAFVPRLIYPNKPIMTPGKEFTELVTGQSDSHTVAGIFGEAYWNGGWPYVILTCIYVGLLLSIFSILSIWHIGGSRLAYLPVTFMGIYVGLLPADWFVSTFIGGIAQVAILYFIISYLIMPIISRKDFRVVV